MGLTLPLPCPFCGSTDITTEREPNTDPELICGICKRCLAKGPPCTDIVEAVLAWDERSGHD